MPQHDNDKSKATDLPPCGDDLCAPGCTVCREGGPLDQTPILAAARGREEFAEGWGLDSCPYPDDGEMRTAWINAWCDAEEAANGKS